MEELLRLKHRYIDLRRERMKRNLQIRDQATAYIRNFLRERDFIQSVDHPQEGKVELLGWAARLSESEVPMKAAPQLGEATDEILSRDLGLDRKALERLVQEGTIALAK